MRRAIWACILFGLAGACVTIAVATASAILIAMDAAPDQTWVRKAGNLRDPSLAAGSAWQLTRFERVGATRVVAMSRSAVPSDAAPPLLPAWTKIDAYCLGRSAQLLSSQRTAGGAVAEDARGWPLRALWCRWDWTLSAQEVQRIGQVSGGIAMSPSSVSAPGSLDIGAQRAIPFSVIPLGFGLDTLFWGTLLWLLARGAGLWQRVSRRRRRLCVHCKYSLGVSSSQRCPECGTPVGN